MKFVSICILFTCLSGWHMSPAPVPSEPAPLNEFCELAGSVYVETTAGFADYRVFVEEDDMYSEMNVFKEQVAAFATESGVWHFTENRGMADFSIYIEEVQTFADFTITYTDFRAEAGCN